MPKSRRVSDDVIRTTRECAGEGTVLARMCDEIITARSARATEMSGTSGRVVFQVVTLQAAPRRSIPYDMLRYDRCMPLTEHDSTKMERLRDADLSGSDWSVETAEDRIVKVLRISPNGGMPSGRWASFGVQVLDVKRGWNL